MTTADLLARLDALTTRLEEQQTEIRSLRAQVARQPSATGGPDDNRGGLSRRDLLVKGAAGVAATALVASQVEEVQAGTRTTVFADNTASYGAAFTYPASMDPAGFLPALTTTHAVIASSSASAAVPQRHALICGTAQSVNGVLGTSVQGVGVFGEIPPASSSNTIAVYGLNNAVYAGPGSGAGGFGVYGFSAKGHGLVGATATAGGAAVVGATSGVAGSYAGAFYGPVIVAGPFTVVGGAKSAAVLHPDGSHRRLYCLESPESWFEDFGRGELSCGRADVTIDLDFAALVDLNDYHVFVTSYDRDYLLYVTDMTPEGFMVRADVAFEAVKGRQATDLSGAFSWRVVAKRKDIEGKRLEQVSIPAEPSLPSSGPGDPDVRDK
jgi:hypothetical protein